MNILVQGRSGEATGTLTYGEKTYACILGRSGIVTDKKEGDGGTPTGTYKLRYVYYRPDRIPAPHTALPITALTETMGWCDDPAHADYNRPVMLPFAASHEELWRQDHVYDLILVIGHNDDPPVAGMGSAIFMHLQQPDQTPTAGCVALTQGDMVDLLGRVSPDSEITIELI